MKRAFKFDTRNWDLKEKDHLDLEANVAHGLKGGLLFHISPVT